MIKQLQASQELFSIFQSSIKTLHCQALSKSRS